MKSQQQEVSIKTNCKNCAFAIYSINTQVGCEHNRLEKFNNIIEAYDDEKEFFIINRLCNYYRDKNWGYTNTDIDRAQKESATSFDILFNYKILNDDHVHHILNIINNNKYYSNKCNIILFHNYVDDSIVTEKIIHISKNSKYKINISVCYESNNFVDNYVTKSKSDFHVVVDQENILSFNSDQLLSINDNINKDLEKNICFKYNNIFYIHNLTYKSLFNTEDNNGDYTENKKIYIDTAKTRKIYRELI